jgi:hypothetical protein
MADDRHNLENSAYVFTCLNGKDSRALSPFMPQVLFKRCLYYL